jgi:hypothetical protein
LSFTAEVHAVLFWPTLSVTADLKISGSILSFTDEVQKVLFWPGIAFTAELKADLSLPS